MAAKKKQPKKYLVKTNDPKYCGIGAGGIQFAYGKAEIHEGWVLDWYKDHGYKVEEIKEEPAEAPAE